MKMQITRFLVGGIFLAAVAVVSAGMGGNPRPKGPAGRLGGPCAYNDYPGTATIVRVDKTDASRAQGSSASGPGYEGYEIRFRFVTDQEIKEEWARPAAGREYLFQLANSWYPGARYIEKYNIKKGNSYPCAFRVITSGTCTPTIFDIPALKKDDYFETAR